MRFIRTSIMALLVASVISTLALTGLASAQNWGQGMGPMNCPWMSGSGAPQLSAEQQATMQRIYREHGQELNSLRQQLWAKQAELNAYLAAPSPDDAKVKALTKEIVGLEEKTLNAEVALRGKLTKEGLPSGAVNCPCPMMMGSNSGMGRGMGNVGNMGNMGPMSCPWMGAPTR